MRALIILWGLLLGGLGLASAAVERAKIDFDFVRERAREKSRAPYAPSGAPLPSRLATLSYDEYRQIEFRPEHALWRDDRSSFVVHLFPRGGLFHDPVAINEFSSTHVQRVPFVADWFKLGKIAGLSSLPNDTDYAGFKVLYPLNRPGLFDEVISFIGASYFRALGAGQHYGLSARGLALDAGRTDAKEEFPRFTEFWLGKPTSGAALTMYALLEGPSVTGAYEFILTPGASTFVDVRAFLVFRKAGPVVGLAPLTSMFWYGENTARPEGELRPEVHDSDGLFVQSEGEAGIWRPLAGVAGQHDIPVPKLARFGLLQRDRDTGSYEDLEARYETRPSAWIEPREGLGRGTVRLVELAPTKEYADNVVAYWVPEAPPAEDRPREFRYRIVWSRGEPDAGVGRVQGTRAGARPGGARGRMFWVDFSDPKAKERVQAALKPEIEIGDGGRLIHAAVSANPAAGGWRVAVEAEAMATHPIDLNCRIRDAAGVFTETWSYTWNPQP